IAAATFSATASSDAAACRDALRKWRRLPTAESPGGRAGACAPTPDSVAVSNRDCSCSDWCHSTTNEQVAVRESFHVDHTRSSEKPSLVKSHVRRRLHPALLHEIRGDGTGSASRGSVLDGPNVVPGTTFRHC